MVSLESKKQREKSKVCPARVVSESVSHQVLRLVTPTNLEIKDMRPVTRLYPHGLVLVCVIQWPLCVCMDGEVECRHATLKHRIERCTVSVLGWLCDDFAAAETQLRRAIPGSEDRRIVDDDADWLLIYVPYRCRAVGAAEKLEVLQGENIQRTLCGLRRDS